MKEPKSLVADWDLQEQCSERVVDHCANSTLLLEGVVCACTLHNTLRV